MRTFCLLLACFAALTFAFAGCAGPANFHEIADQPLSVAVVSDRSTQANCWSMYRSDPVVVVSLHVANLGLQAVGAPDYDVFGLDEKGDDYPMCPHDEPTFMPGDEADVDLVFAQSDTECGHLATLVVKQFYHGLWTEVATLPSGIEDPC